MRTDNPMTAPTHTPAEPWPDPARPGVPLNPERSDPHWVGGTVMLWVPFKVSGGWRLLGAGGGYMTAEWAAKLNYEGPCPAPADVAAQVAAAAQAERERFRRLATDAARHVEIPEDASFAEAHGRLWGALAAAEAIHNLDPATTTDALADLLAQEREKGRREGMALAYRRANAIIRHECSAFTEWSASELSMAAQAAIKLEAVGKYADEAAIRALAAKKGAGG